MRPVSAIAASPAPGPVILSVAYPYAPVGAGAVGGAEVILSQLEAALPGLGFRSVVVAHGASHPVGRLYPTVVPAGEITESVRAAVEASQQRAIDRALAENPVALVHMHGLDFHRYNIPADIPVVVTLHLPPAWYPEAIWDLPETQYRFVCVSETQRQACPEPVRGRVLVIENGVPLPDAATLRSRGHYALLMARICPEKNLHTGLDAARLAGMPAMLGGEVFAYEAHQRYFREQIEPRLSASGTTHESRHNHPESPRPAAPETRFLGPVTGAAKTRLLARAACLLLPSLAPETSSLVAMEALAAGVPVIAIASGAVPEIVQDGRTGFLLQPGPGAEVAMAAAIRRLPTLDRGVCRAVAEQRFGIGRMLEAYAALYRSLALPVPDPRTAPTAQQAGSLSTPPPAAAPALALSEPFELAHVTRDADFAALQSEWETLHGAAPLATPFQHPAWLLPWWRQFGPDGELHAMTLRSGEGQLLGLLPLYTFREAGSAGEGEDPRGDRKLLLIGAGTTDYLDGLFLGGGEKALAARALDHARRAISPCDSVYLGQLSEGSPLLAAGPSVGWDQAPAEPTSILSVEAALPAKVGANVRRYHRRAAALGKLDFSVADSPLEVLESFEHLVRLHRERWESRGEAGVLGDPRVLAHHREALPELAAAGLVLLFRLSLAGNTVAVIYALADPANRPEQRLYLYLIGIDPQLAAISPGTLLLHHVWEYAREHGFRYIDLLRGGESYKQLWGAAQQPTFSLSHASAPEPKPATDA